MHDIYGVAHFEDLDRDTRSQWIGDRQRKTIFKLRHSNCMTVDLCMTYFYVHVCLDDLVLDFENVCKGLSFLFQVFYNNKKLKNCYRVLSSNVGKSGARFISTFEGELALMFM